MVQIQTLVWFKFRCELRKTVFWSGSETSFFFVGKSGGGSQSNRPETEKSAQKMMHLQWMCKLEKRTRGAWLDVSGDITNLNLFTTYKQRQTT
jgi:hypothetical protein